MQIQKAPSERVILRTLAYYDIFKYPLTEKDISEGLSLDENTANEYRNTLDHLTKKGIIFKFGDYYSLTNDERYVHQRIKGNMRAGQWMKKAHRFSRLISHFPFVRSVSLSVSLSKGFIGEDPDIDYFIITEPNRLWLARTMLVVFKKAFLFNSHKYFCINYFIDTENLEIEEKNLFTATEVKTLIPVYGEQVARDFFSENNWIRKYYPNFKVNGLESIHVARSSVMKRVFEFLLNGKHGEWMDNRFMDITVNHWYKKFQNKYSDKEFNLVFKSNKKISKHHPRNFQKKVLIEFNNRLMELRKNYNIDIEPEPLVLNNRKL